jgi:hypothetical protein
VRLISAMVSPRASASRISARRSRGPYHQQSLRSRRGLYRPGSGFDLRWLFLQAGPMAGDSTLDCPARLCHRCHLSATWTASGASAAVPSA